MTTAYLLSLLIIAGKSVAIYIFIIGAIRLFGKKELAQLSVVDLVFILLISNSVQNAMVGPDTSLIGGLSAAVALFIVNYVFKLLINRFSGFSNFVQGHALMLIYEGKVIHDNCNKAMISQEELESAVREHGVKDLSDVDLAVLEVDGNISVISNDYKKKTVRRRKSHKVLNQSQ